MLTGQLRSQIDGIWNDFWSGGLANPLQVIEQITYLIFIKRLDEIQETGGAQGHHARQADRAANFSRRFRWAGQAGR
jgi:HsdM N-terminal domain